MRFKGRCSSGTPCTPTNAVHVMRIPAVPDQDRLRQAINGTLETRALTGLTLNQAQGTIVTVVVRLTARSEISMVQRAHAFCSLPKLSVS